jgi:hypothetical protein
MVEDPRAVLKYWLIICQLTEINTRTWQDVTEALILPTKNECAMSPG